MYEIDKKIIKDIDNINFIEIKWYNNSKKLIELLSKKYKIDKEVIAGILAITSIRNSIKKNLELTLTVLDNIKYLPLGNNESFIDNLKTLNVIKKKLKIFLTTLDFDKINGIKIKNFYNNLLGNDGITVDIWIYRYFEKRFNINRLSDIEIIINRIAKKLNVKPYEIQAKLWIISKRLYGKNKISKYYLDFLHTYNLYFRNIQLTLDNYQN